MIETIEKPTMKPGDIHIVFNPSAHVATAFLYAEPVSQSKKLFSYEAHGEGVNGPGFDKPGSDSVPGLYLCGSPIWTTASDTWKIHCEYGVAFLPLQDYQGNEGNLGRAGIGHHGGGSILADPMAPRQGWAATMGCVRGQNEDITMICKKVETWHKENRHVWFTVENWS